MGSSRSLFFKEAVRRVPPHPAVEVQLLTGRHRRLVKVGRPLEYSDLTLLSRSACSRPPQDVKGFGYRAIGKRIVSRWGIPFETDCFLDTRPTEPNNVAHLLLDIIPLCLIAKEVVGECQFIFRSLHPIFKGLLAHFGINAICISYRPVSGKQLTFRLARGLAQYEVGPMDAPIYSYTGEVYGGNMLDGKGPSKIFISRRGPRSPSNAERLYTLLQDRGFVVVYLEDHSISDQIALVQAATQVIAIHGAALGYLAVKKWTDVVVEIMPPNVYHDYFPVAIGHKVGRYFQLISHFDEQIQFNGWSAIAEHKQQPFSVDLEQLKVVLDEIEDEPKPTRHRAGAHVLTG